MHWDGNFETYHRFISHFGLSFLFALYFASWTTRGPRTESGFALFTPLLISFGGLLFFRPSLIAFFLLSCSAPRKYSSLTRDSNHKKRVTWFDMSPELPVAVVEYISSYPTNTNVHGNAKHISAP
jgi:hypothetical protein